MEDDTPHMNHTRNSAWHAELPTLRTLTQILARQAAFAFSFRFFKYLEHEDFCFLNPDILEIPTRKSRESRESRKSRPEKVGILDLVGLNRAGNSENLNSSVSTCSDERRFTITVDSSHFEFFGTFSGPSFASFPT